MSKFDIKAFPFKFVGSGKVLMDGKEVNAEIKFSGKISEILKDKVDLELVADETNTRLEMSFFDLDK